MQIKHIIFASLWTLVISANYKCDKQTVLQIIKRPVYSFSTKLLQRVYENSNSNFVFSPISTWVQLSAVAEGATGRTVSEIRNVTRHLRNKCYKTKLGNIIVNMNRKVKSESKENSVIVIDKLMGVKKQFVRNVHKYYGVKVMLVDFQKSDEAAQRVNDVMLRGISEEDSVVYYDDFSYRVMLLTDVSYFTSKWKTAFNRAYTKVEPFYHQSTTQIIGHVNMMNQLDYFNLAEFPYLNASVLEIPFENKYLTMLIFLPTGNNTIHELYYKLERTTLTAIFNLFKEQGRKLVNVSLPRFKQETVTENLIELIYDMGVKDLFDPYNAKLKGVSRNTMYASFMVQNTYIYVNETGVTAGVSVADNLVYNDTSASFTANKPFLYMIVDRTTTFILYSGVYSMPSLY